MNKTLSLILCLGLCPFSLAVFGDDNPGEILLWPDGAPGSGDRAESEKVRVTSGGERVISNVHHPSVTPYLTDNKKATAAVIIAPGADEPRGSPAKRPSSWLDPRRLND